MSVHQTNWKQDYVSCVTQRPNFFCLTIIIPERSATAEATPILWASNSATADELEFIPRGVGTSCSTTEPVIRLTTAKVPENRTITWVQNMITDTGHRDKDVCMRWCNYSKYCPHVKRCYVDMSSYLWTRVDLCQKTYRGPQGRRTCKGQILVPRMWVKQRPCLLRVGRWKRKKKVLLQTCFSWSRITMWNVSFCRVTRLKWHRKMWQFTLTVGALLFIFLIKLKNMKTFTLLPFIQAQIFGIIIHMNYFNIANNCQWWNETKYMFSCAVTKHTFRVFVLYLGISTFCFFKPPLHFILVANVLFTHDFYSITLTYNLLYILHAASEPK